MNLGNFLIRKIFLLFLLFFVINIRCETHELYNAICLEIDTLKKNTPEKTIFFITQYNTPFLYNFLTPTLNNFCVISNITHQPQLILKVGPESYNAGANKQILVFDENLLKLFLCNKSHSNYIFSDMAHELGHIFHDSEILADTFAVHITQNGEQLIKALTIPILATRLFTELNILLPNLDLCPIVAETIYTVYPIILQTLAKHAKNRIPNNQLFTKLFQKALQTINKPLDPITIKQELTQTLKKLCTNRSYIEELISTNTCPNNSTHPPLCERILNIKNIVS